MSKHLTLSHILFEAQLNEENFTLYPKETLTILFSIYYAQKNKQRLAQYIDEFFNENKDIEPRLNYEQIIALFPSISDKLSGKTNPNSEPQENQEQPNTEKTSNKQTNESTLDEVTPPGAEQAVRKMKKNPNIDNPYALAWNMKNKGYTFHKKNKKR